LASAPAVLSVAATTGAGGAGGVAGADGVASEAVLVLVLLVLVVVVGAIDVVGIAVCTLPPLTNPVAAMGKSTRKKCAEASSTEEEGGESCDRE